MYVTLSHMPNPDVRGGYWEAPGESGATRRVPVASLARASAVCRAYIERNGLGSGNWTGGNVTRDGIEPVARISYNGRAWAPDGRELPLVG